MHFRPFLSIQKAAAFHSKVAKTCTTMAFKKNLSQVSISLFIIMVIMTPFVHSSRSHGGIEPASDTHIPTQVRYVKSLDVGGDNQQSARQVPTGPDPLHHNGNPARP